VALSIERIVDISDRISPRSTLRREIGRTLFVTTDTDLDAAGAGKVQAFSSVAEVAAVFGADSRALAGARVYFAQTPYPRDLLIGRYVDADADSELRGKEPDAVDELDSISDGAFAFLGHDFAGLDLTSATTFAAVATALQNELRTGGSDFTNATVEYESTNKRFVVSLPARPNPTDADERTFGTSGTPGGTDVSSRLGLSAAKGATFHPGATAEATAGATLDAIYALDSSF